MTPPDRICASCGRSFAWRRKWARDWEQVRYCSDACRRHGVDATDRALEDAILGLLGDRAVGGEEWRPLMEPARRAARRLVAAQRIEITQAGRVVDPSTSRGPVRLRLRR